MDLGDTGCRVKYLIRDRDGTPPQRASPSSRHRERPTTAPLPDPITERATLIHLNVR
jgi:hypothetical protein